MIETEKATDRMDLPHKYDRTTKTEARCVCGRSYDDAIHNARPITEQAAHSAPLQTEKGS